MKKISILFLAVGLTIFTGCEWNPLRWFSKKTCPLKKEVTIKDENIILITKEEDYKKEIENNKEPVIAKFYTNWCGACIQMEPAYKKAANKFKGKIKFVKIDSGKLGPLSEGLNIQGVPTFIFFKDGKEVERHVGGMPEDEFIEKVEVFINK